MTTATINTTANSGRINSTSTTYSSAQSGTGLSEAVNQHNMGQLLAGSSFELFESFFDFDTSSIPSGATISSVALSIWGSADHSTTDCILEARLFDYGTSLTTADWLATTSLSSQTRLATFNTSGGWSTTGYNTFTEDGTNFKTNLNFSGVTRIIISSDRVAAGTHPTGDEYVIGISHSGTSSEWPQLVVTYTTVTTSNRVVSSTTGFKATLNRIVSSTSILKATVHRVISSTTALKGTQHRVVSSITGLKATLSRVVSSTTLFVAGGVRTISSTTVLKGTQARVVSSTTALKATLSRTISSSTLLKATLSRVVNSTTILKASVARTISSSTILSGSRLRVISSTTALKATVSRVVNSTTLLTLRFSRAVASTTLFKSTVHRVISSTTILKNVSHRVISSTTLFTTPPLCPPLDAIVTASRTQAALIHPGPSDAVVVNSLNTSALFVSGPNDAIVAPSRTSFIACWKD